MLRATLAASLLAVWAGTPMAADGDDDGVLLEVDRDTGLKSWHYEGGGLGIELVQVPPDFIRASYAARGLPEAVREAVASRCVFGTIVRNLGEAPLHYRVADWRYRNAAGEQRAIKTKSAWLEEWHAMGVRFSWSILADEPTFAAGDWIQGFTTMAEAHGSRLDLTVVWTIAGERYEKVIPGLECAPPPADD
jgi:hypothetical protein